MAFQDGAKMKIAIAFFGLPRCSEKAFPSIEENILMHLPPGSEVKCFYHFYLQNQVVSAHSQENGDFNQSNYEVFKQFEGILEKPEDVLPSLPFEGLKKFGDAWKGDFNSLKNLLLQLHSLKKVTELVEVFDPDCVFYVRPDLVYHDPINSVYYQLAQQLENSVFLPEWQWGLGVNDRFAVLGKHAYKIYGKRLDEAMNYCVEGNCPLHSERFLKHVLLKNHIEILILNAKASRVRINGDIVSEKFKTNISFFSPISNSQKRFLFVTQIKTKLKLRSLKKRT